MLSNVAVAVVVDRNERRRGVDSVGAVFMEAINSVDNTNYDIIQTSQLDGTLLWNEDDDFSVIKSNHDDDNNTSEVHAPSSSTKITSKGPCAATAANKIPGVTSGTPEATSGTEDLETATAKSDLERRDVDVDDGIPPPADKDQQEDKRSQNSVSHTVTPEIQTDRPSLSTLSTSPPPISVSKIDAKVDRSSPLSLTASQSPMPPLHALSEGKHSPDLSQRTLMSTPYSTNRGDDISGCSFAVGLQTPYQRPIAEVEHSRRKHAARAFEFGIRCQTNEGKVQKLLKELEDIKIFSETERMFKGNATGEGSMDSEKMKDLEGLMKDATDKVENLSSQLKSANDQILLLRDDNASLSATVEMCEMATASHEEDKQKIKCLEEELRKAQKCSTAPERINILEEELEEATKKVNERNAFVEMLSAKAESEKKQIVDQYEASIKKLQNNYTSAQKTAQETLSNRDKYWQKKSKLDTSKKEDIEIENKSLKLIIQDMKNKMTDAEALASEQHQKTVTDYQVQIHELQQKVNHLEQEERTQLDQAESVIVKLKSKLEETEILFKKEKASKEEQSRHQRRSMSSELEKLKQSLISREEKCHDIEASLETRNKTIASLQRSLAESDGEAGAWRGKVKSLEQELKSSEEMATRASTNLEMREAEISMLNDSKEDLEDKLQLLREEHDIYVADSEKITRDMEEQLAKSEIKLKEKDGLLEELDMKLELLLKERIDLQEQLGTLRKETDEICTFAAEFEKENALLRDQLSSLNEKLEEWNTKNQAIDEMKRNVIELSGTIESLKDTIIDRDQKIFDISNLLQESKQINDNSKSDLIRLESDFDALKAHYNNCDDELNELKALKAKQEEKISELSCANKSLSCEIDEKKSHTQNIDEANKQSQDHIELLETKLKARLTECENKDSLLIKCEKHIKFLQNNNRFAEEDRMELNDKLSSARKMLATLKEDKEQLLAEKINLSKEHQQVSKELAKVMNENVKCNEMFANYDSINSQLIHMKECLVEEEKKYKSLETEKEEIEKELTETNDLATSAAEQLDILQDQVDQTNSELESARHAAESAISELENITVKEEMVWDLQNKLKDANNQIFDLREELKLTISKNEDLKARTQQQLGAESFIEDSTEFFEMSEKDNPAEYVFGLKDEGASRKSIERAALTRFLRYHQFSS